MPFITNTADDDECYRNPFANAIGCQPHCEVPTTPIPTNSYEFLSGVWFYSGSFKMGTTHIITSVELPLLNNSSLSGDITFYLKNGLYVNVTMGAIVKAGGVILQALAYQRVGNYTSVDLTVSGNTIVLTTNPASTVKWLFRGC